MRLFSPKKPSYASAAYPVPDTESLRLLALEKSQQRGRRVAQRRILLRWCLWLLWRYALPAIAGLALLSALFHVGRQYFERTTPVEQLPLTLKPATSLHIKETP